MKKVILLISFLLLCVFLSLYMMLLMEINTKKVFLDFGENIEEKKY